jgi:hypothetical protein
MNTKQQMAQDRGSEQSLHNIIAEAGRMARRWTNRWTKRGYYLLTITQN